MADRGHQVACVVRPESRLAEKLSAAGVPIWPLPLVDWFEPVTISRLRRWLVSQRIQVLHTHLPRDYYIAAVATLGTAVLNIGTRHQLHPISLPWLKRPFLRRFETMIAVSEAVRRGVVAAGVLPAERVVTIHNGIEIGPDPQAGPATDLRTAAGIAPEAPVIGCVGRICPSKGLETLIDAVVRLRPRWPDLKVLFLGDAPDGGLFQDELQRLAERLGVAEAIVFCGYVDNAGQAGAAFDIQVVSSLAEPFGLVTLEAMSHGIPVVVTNSGGSPEIVRDGQEGFLVQPGDGAAMAARIEQLLLAPALRRELGGRGRRRVAAIFSRERMLDGVEETYRNILGRSELSVARQSA
jgi:glycosyltransferase involved in cell wall biosynthesis